MQQHREEAQNAAAAAAAGQRRIKDAERRARLQATLQRQQVISGLTLPASTYASICIPTIQKPFLKITFMKYTMSFQSMKME